MSSHDFTLNESKTVASTSFGAGYLNLTHSQLSQAYFASSEDDREELSATLEQTIGAGWSLTASQIWDLSYRQNSPRKDHSSAQLGRRATRMHYTDGELRT